MSRGLKITFLLHAICAFLFGVSLYLLPAYTSALINWPDPDLTMSRFFGAAMLAICLKSWLCYRADRYEAVRISVIFEMCYCFFGSIIGLYAVLFTGAPVFTWISIVVWLVFLSAFTYFYFKNR